MHAQNKPSQARLAGACVSALMLCAAVNGSDYSSPRSYPIGVGARATALGNNYTAVAQDFSALQYNPAGLGFMRSREAHMALNGLVVHNSTLSATDSASKANARLRLGSGGLLWAAPASQGGLAFAIGYQCPTVFDDAVQYQVSRGLETDHFTLNTQGHLNYYSVGMGLQLAPGFSGGVTASVIGGNLDVTARRHYTVDGELIDTVFDYYQRTISRNYLGYDIRFGLLYQFGDIVSLGARFVLPKTIRFSGTITDRYPLWPADSMAEYDDPGRLRYMYEGALGMAFRLPILLISPEIGFRGAHLSADEGSDAGHWKIGGGIGIEAPVAASGVLLRLGYRFEQYDEQPALTTYGDDKVPAPAIGVLPRVHRDAHQFSGGLAYVTPSALCFELSYAYRMWETQRGGVTHAYGTHQAMASVSLRY